MGRCQNSGQNDDGPVPLLAQTSSALLPILLILASCNNGTSGVARSTGGATGAGGGNGGHLSSGGTMSLGGSGSGSGGVVQLGGTSGGASAAGGTNAAAGSGGGAGAAGATGLGGAASGGATVKGGTSGSGGVVGSGGTTGLGGAAGLDASPPDGAQLAGDVERWGMYEITLIGPSTGNPYVDVQWSATFSQGTQNIKVPGFWDGGSSYKVRFSPPTTGQWNYTTSSAVPELNGKTGSLQVVEASVANHGPVQVIDTYYLRYADGARYHQFGTTSYAWVHQTDAIQDQTLKTLATAPFNKMRMTVFPKDYTYNKNDPPYYAFVQNPGSVPGKYSFDFTKPDPVFWKHFEQRILDLQKLGIEADIILFHPYDRWGFKNMGATHDDRYLRYCIARFSAYRNVWWSLANEWNFCAPEKAASDFDRFGQIVGQEDPHHRMCSIHGTDACYSTQFDYTKPYLTHAGLQSSCEDSGETSRNQWKKPIIYDESRYEGDIPEGFGNLTALEMMQRFWTATFVGTYQGHSECFKDPNDVLWWSKGNVLKGQSPARIKWLADLMAQAPAFNELVPQRPNSNTLVLAKDSVFYMVYCLDTAAKTITLAGTSSYAVDQLDPYAMTVTPVGTASPGSYAFTPPKADVIYRFSQKL